VLQVDRYLCIDRILEIISDVPRQAGKQVKSNDAFYQTKRNFRWSDKQVVDKSFGPVKNLCEYVNWSFYSQY